MPPKTDPFCNKTHKRIDAVLVVITLVLMINYDGLGNVDLTLTAVPEPSTWIVGALSLAALVCGGRRRFIHLTRSS